MCSTLDLLVTSLKITSPMIQPPASRILLNPAPAYFGNLCFSRERERGERDVGIICVIIYDDLALEAWTQREREERREAEERGRRKRNTH